MEFNAPPFTEEVLTYSVDTFPFAERVCQTLLGNNVANSLPLSKKLNLLKSLDESHQTHRCRGQGRAIDEAIYHRFIRDFVRPHLGDEMVLFESFANLRTHIRGSRALTGPHKDADFKHSQFEINFWVPITPVFGNASLWVESSPGLGDYHPFVAEYGQAIRFYGNKCMHFTKDNDTDTTRLSFDFRVIRLRDFSKCGVPVPGQDTEEPWILFRYYSIMGPDGVIGENDWSVMALRARTLLSASDYTLIEHRVFEGVIDRLKPQGFGFIKCAETKTEYSSEDVYLHKSLVGDLYVGAEVSFQICMGNNGQIRAVGIQAGGIEHRLIFGLEDQRFAEAALANSMQDRHHDAPAVMGAPDNLRSSGSKTSLPVAILDSKIASVPLERSRSTSAEHKKRCELRFGSTRSSRRNCARCSWLANREHLLKTLIYTDASGEQRPWVSENPNNAAPWGLGCRLCRAARDRGVSVHIPSSSFTEFTFGTDAEGLLVQPLVRHGNHGAHKQGDTFNDRVARDEGHDAAVIAVADGALVINPDDRPESVQSILANSSISGLGGQIIRLYREHQ